MALIKHVIKVVLELRKPIYRIMCRMRRSHAINYGHHKSTPTILNSALLVLLERAREGAYNDVNNVYI
jgi:hypothetical protein